MSFDLSIIVPTYNREQILKRTIKSLIEASKGFNVEIIIINDSSDDLELKEEYRSYIKVFKNNKGKGVASARNTGAQIASSDILLFLDDDIIISEMVLKQLLNHFNNNPNYIYLPYWQYPDDLLDTLNNTSFGRFLYSHNLMNIMGYSNIKANYQNNHSLIEIPNGASYCLLIEKIKFLNVGGYNESFPYAGAEDYEFCQRLKECGFKFFIDLKLIVYHNEADRINLKEWLERKKRDSYTRKICAGLGYSIYHLSYSRLKSYILDLVYTFRNLFFLLLKFIPNHPFFDNVYSKIVDILIAAYIYAGYNKNK